MAALHIGFAALNFGTGSGIVPFCFFGKGMARIGKSFFDRGVDGVARQSINTTFIVDGVGGVIVETESYDASDPASHSFGMRQAVLKSWNWPKR
jgi:hypothetical protein